MRNGVDAIFERQDDLLNENIKKKSIYVYIGYYQTFKDRDTLSSFSSVIHKYDGSDTSYIFVKQNLWPST